MINYFGYGSNMDMTSLRAKGVVPQVSRQAVLRGWRLRFNVAHFFRHEGGVGNIERTDRAEDRVFGILHGCNDDDLAALDRLEARGIGYDRILVEVETDAGRETAYAYVGLPEFIDDSRLPTQRYLNILLRGAEAAGLDPAYIGELSATRTLSIVEPSPFVCPAGGSVLDHTDLVMPRTALAGHLFDMSRARAAHRIAQVWFGGRDVTLFLLRRMDSSTGDETEADVVEQRINADQRRYLEAYLHAFDDEYDYVGRFDYRGLPSAKHLR